MLGMKTKALYLWLGLSVSLLAQEYWIQVLSVKGEVPASFLDRVQQSGQAYKVIESAAGRKVWLGSYASRADTEKALSLIRCSMASDAFIVQEEAKELLVEQVPEKLAVAARNGLVKSRAKSSVPVKEKGAAEKEKAEPCTCICDKRALHKAEISSAMAFYRNSSDYRFSGEDRLTPGF